jgi:thioredoxin reductase (NADPH)
MLDLLIIGSGPAGLSAAVYAIRSNLNIMVAEKDFLGTGQIMNSIQVDNYLGYWGITGMDLGERFRLHAEELRVPFYTGQAVSIHKEGEVFRTGFDNGEILEARSVIYAAGTRERHLTMTGAERYRGRGIYSCVLCDGPACRNKAVAVIGGGNTAVDAARYMSDIASQVYLITIEDHFRANPSTIRKLEENPRVEMICGATAVYAGGEDSERLGYIVLSNGRKLRVEGVFESIGLVPCTEMVADLVKRDPAGYIIAGEDCMTSLEGFYAAGDIRTKRLRQVATAVADGSNAAMSAYEYLNA